MWDTPRTIEVELELNGERLRWVWRVPTRADQREATALAARKIAAQARTGMEAQLVEALDGNALFWEAMLEIGLRPRVIAGETVSLGETAPEHWFREVRDQHGRVIDKVIDFSHVSTEEFTAVVRAIDEKKRQLTAIMAISPAASNGRLS